MRKTAIALTVAALALAGCSGDEGTDTATGGGNGDDGGSTATTEAPTCPSETDLEVTGGGEYSGPFDVTWALADDGPGYLNGDDTNIDLGFASFDIPEDEQFGIGIPTGGPEDPPEDGLYLNIYLETTDGATIGADQTFSEDMRSSFNPETDTVTTADTTDPSLQAYDGSIGFLLLQQGSERLTLDDIEVTLTEVSEQYVCGTITTADNSSLQDLTGIEGEFKADRIEYLDGEEYEGAGGSSDDGDGSTDDTMADDMDDMDETDDTMSDGDES